MRAALRNVARVVAKVQQRIERTVSYEINVPAASTVSSGWTTARNKLLTSKSGDTVTTVAPLNVNLRAVDKHLKLKTTPGAQSHSGSGVVKTGRSLLSSSLLQWIDAHELPSAPLIFKLHNAIDQSEQRIVFTTSNIVAGLPFSSALTRNDVAAQHLFAAELL